MGASRFFLSLFTTAKQSVIPSFQRSPPASIRSSFLRRIWPFPSSDSNKSNSPKAVDDYPLRTIHYQPPARKARKESIRVFTQEEADEIEGCDFQHWTVVTVPPFFPNRKPTRDEEIDYYIKTLAKVVGSEEEARKKIYSVFTQWRFNSFGVNVSEEVAIKIDELPNVYHVVPDFYMDHYKRYPGEPFINGQAVPFHCKYHEEYLYSLLPEDMRKRISPPYFEIPPHLLALSRSRKALRNNFSRPNMGQPQSDCGVGVQPEHTGEPGHALAFQHGNVPMNHIVPNKSVPGLEQNKDGPNICGG